MRTTLFALAMIMLASVCATRTSAAPAQKAAPLTTRASEEKKASIQATLRDSHKARVYIYRETRAFASKVKYTFDAVPGVHSFPIFSRFLGDPADAKRTFTHGFGEELMKKATLQLPPHEQLAVVGLGSFAYHDITAGSYTFLFNPVGASLEFQKEIGRANFTQNVIFIKMPSQDFVTVFSEKGEISRWERGWHKSYRDESGRGVGEASLLAQQYVHATLEEGKCYYVVMNAPVSNNMSNAVFAFVSEADALSRPAIANHFLLPDSGDDVSSVAMQAGSVVVPNGLLASDVEQAILGAGTGRGWTVKEKTDGKVMLFLSQGGWHAMLTFNYDTKNVQIISNSGKVDKNGKVGKPEVPKSWVKNLMEDMTKRFSSLKQNPTAKPATP